MANAPVELPAPRRDGTSQAARVRADLDPAGIGPDERTTRDLIAFARVHAERLVYFDAENKRAGDWSGFFAGLTDDQIVGFLDDPRPDADARLRRPHFVLFLAFLRLLGTARDAMNGLTRRHLDYYFRESLRLAPRPPEPDRVFVLFDLAAGANAVSDSRPNTAGSGPGRQPSGPVLSHRRQSDRQSRAGGTVGVSVRG